MSSQTSAERYDVGVGAVGSSNPRCRHGGPLVFPIDPAADYLRPCQKPGVFRVPRPDTDAPLALCAWHLARYLAAYPDVGAQLVADHDANEYAADTEIVRLADAPDPFEHSGREWRRVAIDQHGHVHYASRETPDGIEQPAMLEVDGRLEQVTVTPVDRRVEREYLEAVRSRVGWAGFDDRVRLPTEDGS